jgi:hypothetical protein
LEKAASEHSAIGFGLPPKRARVSAVAAGRPKLAYRSQHVPSRLGRLMCSVEIVTHPLFQKTPFAFQRDGVTSMDAASH